MKNRQKAIVLLTLGILLIWAVFAGMLTYKPPLENEAWTDVSDLARSPAWYVEHCDYIEIDPMDESPDLPDGVYENCDESSTKSPKKNLSDMHKDKTLDPTRIVPGEPARHWEIIPARKLKGSVIY